MAAPGNIHSCREGRDERAEGLGEGGEAAMQAVGCNI